MHQQRLTPFFICAIICLLPFLANSQVQFDTEKLQHPEKFGAEIAGQLQSIEVYEFRDTLPSTFFLKNGFRSSSFVNAEDWQEISDTVEVYRIDVVYSKYPLRKGTYHEIYPLLLNRLKQLFEIDDTLNRSSIVWNKVLQTHCTHDEQVDQLLHGILIWYRPLAPQTESPAESSIIPDAERTAGASQSSYAEFRNSISYVESSPFFSDSLKQKLRGKTMDQQRDLLISTLEKELESKPDQDLTKLQKIDRQRYLTELNTIVNLYRGDSTVYKVLSRHPEWQNVLVVNDWTGSMYGYGTQVVQWHLLNREISGIRQITLFNDGDMKSTNDKVIGSTGGIYTENADNIEKLIGLFQLVMMKGGGGDGPENDIEGILEALEEKDDVSEVILIADNYPCIRDISLASRIPVPVRVIVCGYRDDYGINPDLVYLAKITNGGLYTIEDDLANLQVTCNDSGEITSSSDEKRFRISRKSCDSDKLSTPKTIRMSLWDTRFHLKKNIRHLDLSSSSITDLHQRLYKLTALEYLNLSSNTISRLDPEFGNLKRLQYLNLSRNKLDRLPEEFKEIKYLNELDLSENLLTELPKGFFHQPYLLKLDVSGNHLQQLEKVSNLRRLKECDLSGNRLTEIPRSFQSLKNLRILNLSGNQLVEFPAALYKLRSLEELDLRNNALKQIPKEASELKSLKILHLEGNNFTVEEQERIRLQFPNTLVYF